MYVNDVGWLTMFKKEILAKRKRMWNVAKHYKNLKIYLKFFWDDKAISFSPKYKIIEQRIDNMYRIVSLRISIYYAFITQTVFERK